MQLFVHKGMQNRKHEWSYLCKLVSRQGGQKGRVRVLGTFITVKMSEQFIILSVHGIPKQVIMKSYLANVTMHTLQSISGLNKNKEDKDTT